MIVIKHLNDGIAQLFLVSSDFEAHFPSQDLAPADHVAASCRSDYSEELGLRHLRLPVQVTWPRHSPLLVQLYLVALAAGKQGHSRLHMQCVPNSSGCTNFPLHCLLT